MAKAQIVEDLLAKWATLQTPVVASQTVGSVQTKANEEIAILEALWKAGCKQIPGEAFDVEFLVNDRRRLLREMNARLSRL